MCAMPLSSTPMTSLVASLTPRDESIGVRGARYCGPASTKAPLGDAQYTDELTALSRNASIWLAAGPSLVTRHAGQFLTVRVSLANAASYLMRAFISQSSSSKATICSASLAAVLWHLTMSEASFLRLFSMRVVQRKTLFLRAGRKPPSSDPKGVVPSQ